MNAAEAERAILGLLEPLFCSKTVLERVEAEARQRFAEARGRRVEEESTEARLQGELAAAEAETAR